MQMPPAARLLAALTLASAAALAPAVALACPPPEVETADDHETTGKVLVAADLATVRAIVADPARVAKIDSGPAQIEVSDDGACKLIRTFISHPVASVRYRARQCPKGDGFRTELVESDDFKAYHSEWGVRAVQGGTELVYKVRTIPNISVPQFLVDRQTRAAVERLLERVRAAAEAG